MRGGIVTTVASGFVSEWTTSRTMDLKWPTGTTLPYPDPRLLLPSHSAVLMSIWQGGCKKRQAGCVASTISNITFTTSKIFFTSTYLLMRSSILGLAATRYGLRLQPNGRISTQGRHARCTGVANATWQYTLTQSLPCRPVSRSGL